MGPVLGLLKGCEWVILKLKFLMDQDWRRLVSSPADHNNHFKLELPRAWEPSDSSRTSPYDERKETQFGFPYGNQIT
jgi:hypothetical protein